MTPPSSDQETPQQDPLLQEFVSHLVHERGLSEHSIRSYRSDLTQLVQSQGPLEGLRLARIRAWLADLHEQGLSRSTLNRKIASVRAFSAWSHRRGHLPEDPSVRLRSSSRSL